MVIWYLPMIDEHTFKGSYGDERVILVLCVIPDIKMNNSALTRILYCTI